MSDESRPPQAGDVNGGDAPPGPWVWQKVIPRAPDWWPHTEPMGTALVAADGTWVVSSEIGYRTPEIEPAARDLLARAHLVARLPELIDSWRTPARRPRPSIKRAV